MYHFRAVILAVAFFTIGINAIAQSKPGDSKSIKLLFVGDIMGHGPQVKSAYDASTKSYNYNPCFEYVKPIIEKADLAIGNLEVTLPGKPPYRGYPMFRSPDALGKAVKNAGFDVIVTSNNHSNDGGINGINHTIDVLRDLNIHQTGTFKNEKDYKVLYPLIVYKNGFKLAFLNYTYDTNGLPTPKPAVVNLIDEELIQKDIKAAQELQPDGIIVVMHWGLEYQLNESPVQKDLSQKIFKWGADLVIGAHPHVVQPIKESFEPQADGSLKKQVTVYSMGNFISNQQKKNTDGGIMFEIELHKKANENQITLGEHSFIPVWRYVERKNGKVTYRALPISAVEDAEENPLKLSVSDRNKMTAFAKTTRLHLAKFDSQERKLKWSEIEEKKEKAAPATGMNRSKINQRFLPFKYALGKKMGNTNIAMKGNAPRVVPYYLSTPIYRNKVEPIKKALAAALPDTIKPKKKIQKVYSYQPKNNPSENTPKSGEPKSAQKPKAVFDPNKVPKKRPKGYGFVPKTPVPKNTQVDTSGKKYMIQFQASKNLYPKDKYNYLGNVQIEATPTGWYRYYTGSVNSVAEAKVVLAKCKAAGFNDAFITKKKFIQSLDNENTAKGDSPLSRVVYKVQFQSTQNYYNISPKLFADVLVLEENGWFRYYTGNASSIADANKFLQLVQSKGFKDAFVVTFENGKPK